MNNIKVHKKTQSQSKLTDKIKVVEYYSSEDSEDELDKILPKYKINNQNPNLNQTLSSNIFERNNSLYSISSIGDVEMKTKYSNKIIKTESDEKKDDEEKRGNYLSFFTFDYDRKLYLKYWSDFSKNIEHNEKNQENIKVDWKLFYNKVFKRLFEDKFNNFYSKRYYNDLDYATYINYITNPKNKKNNMSLEEFRLQIILNKLIHQQKGKYGDNNSINKSQNKLKSPEILLINRNKDIGYRGIYKNGISEKDKDSFIPLYITKLQKFFIEFLNKKKYKRKMINIQLWKSIIEGNKGNTYNNNKYHSKFYSSAPKISNKDIEQNNKTVESNCILRCNSNFIKTNIYFLSPTKNKDKRSKKKVFLKSKTTKGIILKNKLDYKKMSINTNNINSNNFCFTGLKNSIINSNNNDSKNNPDNSPIIKLNVISNNKPTLKGRKSRNTIINNSLFFSRFNKKFTNTISNLNDITNNKRAYSKIQNKNKFKASITKKSTIEKNIIRIKSTDNLQKNYNYSTAFNEDQNYFFINFSKKELNNANKPKEKNGDEILELSKKNLNIIINDKLLLSTFLKKYPTYQEELNDLYNNYYLYEKVYEKGVNDSSFYEKNIDFNHYLNTFLNVRKKKNILTPVNQIEINKKIIEKTLNLQNLLDKINSE